MIEGIKIEDRRRFKDAVAGHLGVGALYPLAGHGGPLGKERRGLSQGRPDGFIDLGLHPATLVLIGAAHRQDGTKYRLCVIGQLLTSLRPYLGQQHPFSAGI